MFARLGVKETFGVSGGAMAALWDALSSSALGVYHFRHESGAAFAAIEAGFASGRPTVLFTTTGPGLTNALTGIYAARDEGARRDRRLPAFVRAPLEAASLSRRRRGTRCRHRSTRAAIRFISLPSLSIPADLTAIERALSAGLARPGGFVAHSRLDTAVQRAPVALVAPSHLSHPLHPLHPSHPSHPLHPSHSP